MSAVSIPAAVPSALLGLADSQFALPSGVPTGAACRATGLTYWQLYRLVRQGLISAPPRDATGRLLWGASHIAAALRATDKDRPRGRPRKRADATAASNHRESGE